jgi:hypothetical protein
MVSIRDQNGAIAGFAPLRTCVGVAQWRDTHVVRRRQMRRFQQAAAHRGEPDPRLAGAWLMIAGRMPTFVSVSLLLISVNSHPCR